MTIDGSKERATRKDCLCHARPMLALRVLVDVVVVRRHLLMDLKLDRCRGRVRTVVERLFVPRSQSVSTRPSHTWERGESRTDRDGGLRVARADGGKRAQVHGFVRDHT